ncbi:MAG: glycoside hydrolase family 9 protein [Sedimentisphaerales bacterium]|nr:glycoside hydrolase family 9 protein [Sedimentisphaerales bacterium]
MDQSTAAVADFVAMMAMAASYFKPYDREYAQRCLDAAETSYPFLMANPQAGRLVQGSFRSARHELGRGTGGLSDQ